MIFIWERFYWGCWVCGRLNLFWGIFIWFIIFFWALITFGGRGIILVCAFFMNLLGMGMGMFIIMFAFCFIIFFIRLGVVGIGAFIDGKFWKVVGVCEVNGIFVGFINIFVL